MCRPFWLIKHRPGLKKTSQPSMLSVGCGATRQSYRFEDGQALQNIVRDVKEAVPIIIVQRVLYRYFGLETEAMMM